MAPSKQHIAQVFSPLSRSDVDGFFQHVDPNVGTSHVKITLPPTFDPRYGSISSHMAEWTVQSHSTLGGTYHTAASFRRQTFARLATIMDPSTPMRQLVTNIIGGGEGEDWCTVEMVNEGRTKTGERYDQTYAWCCRWEECAGEWRIVQVRAYLDSGLVDRVVAAAGEKEVK